MFERLPEPRHTVHADAEGWRVCIPARRYWSVVVFSVCWLGGWAFGEAMAGLALVKMVREAHPVGFFLLAWLSLWTLGGAAIIYTVLWQTGGREIVSVSASALSVQRQIFGFGRLKDYALPEVRRLRVLPFVYGRRGGPRGGLAFDYGAKTVQFATEVDEAEARMIWQTMVSRAPQLRETAEKTDAV